MWAIITFAILLSSSVIVSFFSIRYINEKESIVAEHESLVERVDSLKNINESIKVKIQTSLDSINQFYKKYDSGEYELTYPDSILTWNNLIHLDASGNLDESIVVHYIDVLKSTTRSSVLFNELAKGNYDFYINTLNDKPSIAPTFGVITSPFGYRQHPILGRKLFHRGIDIANDLGTPVFCTGDGVIVKSSWDARYGRYIRVRHSGGYESKYAHLSKVLVKTGAIVESGQMIAEMGNTGKSTGSHLHYELKRNNRLLNPYRYMNATYKKAKKERHIS